MTASLRMRVVEAATRAIFEAEWDTVTWEEVKKGYRDNDAWGQFKEDHAFYYQAGEDAVTLILDCLAGNADALVAVQRKGHLSKRRVADIYVDELPAVLGEDR